MIVFMEIRAVTGFSERYDAEEKGEFPGIIAGIKVTGETRVKAESRPIPAENVSA